MDDDQEPLYELVLTNQEVKVMFRSIIRGWFGSVETDHGDFIKALLLGDVDAFEGKNVLIG